MAIMGVNNLVIFYCNVPITTVNNHLDFKFSGRLEDVYTVKVQVLNYMGQCTIHKSEKLQN